jgi:hypothetical protein
MQRGYHAVEILGKLPRMDPIDEFLARLENVDLPDEAKKGFIDTLNILKSLGADDLDAMTKVDPVAIEAEKECGDADECANDFLYAVIDQRDDTKNRKRKWYWPSKAAPDRTGYSRLTKKTGLGFHHTAVFNGFGAWGSIVRAFKKRAEANGWVETSTGLMLPNSDAWDLWKVKPNNPITIEAWARALGLAKRYEGEPKAEYNYGVPYHAILGPNSVLYLNLPFDWVTWHGNSLNNDFLGVAWDANSIKQKISEGLAKDLIYDGERIIDFARSEGHDIQYMDCHSSRTRKPNDPGAEFIREVMMPLADKTGCEILMDTHRGGGESIREILEKAA